MKKVIFLLVGLLLLTIPSMHANAQNTNAILNVTYCSPNGSNALMDMYLSTLSGNHPVVVEIHGGGWSGGHKSDQWALAEYPLLNAEGIDLVSINYRLSEGYHYPAPEQDAQCAIRYLRANAGNYSINPNEIGVFGESAGGQIALMVGLNNVSMFGYGPDYFYENQSSYVQSVATWFAPTNLTQLSDFSSNAVSNIYAEFGSTLPELVNGSPVYYASSEQVPVILYHGYNDTHINYMQSVEMSALLNCPSCLVLVNNAGHDWYHSRYWGTMDPSLKEIELSTAIFFNKTLE